MAPECEMCALRFGPYCDRIGIDLKIDVSSQRRISKKYIEISEFLPSTWYGSWRKGGLCLYLVFVGL